MVFEGKNFFFFKKVDKFIGEERRKEQHSPCRKELHIGLNSEDRFLIQKFLNGQRDSIADRAPVLYGQLEFNTWHPKPCQE